MTDHPDLFARNGIDAGRGPCWLLLHPYPLDHRTWEPLARLLAGRFRVVAPNLPGFGAGRKGDAPWPAGGLSMAFLARRIVTWLRAREIRPAVVAGLSMGGYVALALAEGWPELVPALVLADTRARADTDEERAARLGAIGELEREGPGARDLLARMMVPRLLAPAAPAHLRERVADWVRETAPAAARAALRGMAHRPDRRPVLAGFPGPVLALCGEEDRLTPPAEHEEMAALARRGRLVRIPGAGHLAPLERPGDVARALLGFWDEEVGRR